MTIVAIIAGLAIVAGLAYFIVQANKKPAVTPATVVKAEPKPVVVPESPKVEEAVEAPVVKEEAAEVTVEDLFDSKPVKKTEEVVEVAKTDTVKASITIGAKTQGLANAKPTKVVRPSRPAPRKPVVSSTPRVSNTAKHSPDYVTPAIVGYAIAEALSDDTSAKTETVSAPETSTASDFSSSSSSYSAPSVDYSSSSSSSSYSSDYGSSSSSSYGGSSYSESGSSSSGGFDGGSF